MPRRALKTLLTLALLACAASRPQAAGASQRAAGDAEIMRGRLEDVRGMVRVALLVSNSLVVDVRATDSAAAAFDDYRKAMAGSPPGRHDAAFRQVALKLNKYIRKYGSATAASVEEADLILVFKVTGQQPSAMPGHPYVWGRMYVLALGADRVPRLVWESRGKNSTAEEITGDFLKALRKARGEK